MLFDATGIFYEGCFLNGYEGAKDGLGCRTINGSDDYDPDDENSSEETGETNDTDDDTDEADDTDFDRKKMPKINHRPPAAPPWTSTPASLP